MTFKRGAQEKKMTDTIVGMAKEIEEFDNLMAIGQHFYMNGWSPTAILRLILRQMSEQKAWDIENKNDLILQLICTYKSDLIPKAAEPVQAANEPDAIECPSTDSQTA